MRNIKKTNSMTEVENENSDCMERMLRRFERNESIRLSSCKSVMGSRIGDNYMSVVKRVSVAGKSDQEPDYRRTFIVKRQFPCPSRRELFRCNDAFENEIAAYQHLIPLFRDIVTPYTNPYPECMFAGQDEHGDAVMLEDLRESNFKMANRLVGLDLDHSKIVMKKVGSLHGLSLALMHTKANEFKDARNKVKEIVYSDAAAEFYTHSLQSSLAEVLNSLKSHNKKKELDEPIRLMKLLSGKKIYAIMGNSINKAKTEECVMCHGDLWVNNMMFKYDAEDKVAAVKLMDLQTVRFTSPSIDILHFLYTSTERDVREGCLDELLAVYVDALAAELRSHMAASEKLTELLERFSTASIRRQCDENIMYGLGISMWLMPAVTFASNMIPDLNTVKYADFENATQQKVMTSMQTPEYHSRMRAIVLEYFERGFLSGDAPHHQPVAHI